MRKLRERFRKGVRKRTAVLIATAMIAGTLYVPDMWMENVYAASGMQEENGTKNIEGTEFEETEAETKETEAETKETEAETKEAEAEIEETKAEAEETEAETKETKAEAEETEGETKESEAEIKETEAGAEETENASKETKAETEETEAEKIESGETKKEEEQLEETKPEAAEEAEESRESEKSAMIIESLEAPELEPEALIFTEKPRRKDIPLPGTLKAQIYKDEDSDNLIHKDIAVTWKCDKYDEDGQETYTFIPEWDEEKYTAGSGLEIPSVTIRVDLSDICLTAAVENMEVEVTAKAGILPANSSLKASLVTDEETLSQIQGLLEKKTSKSSGKQIDKIIPIDITIIHDGKEIQPKGEIKVVIRNLQRDVSESSECKVYHVSDDVTSATPVKASADEEKVEFSAEHFSLYTMFYYSVAATVAKIGDEKYETLEAAVASSSNASKIELIDQAQIELTDDIELKKGSIIVVPENASATINGNGKTIKYADISTIEVQGNLVMENVNVDANTKKGYGAISLTKDNADLTLNSCKVTQACAGSGSGFNTSGQLIQIDKTRGDGSGSSPNNTNILLDNTTLEVTAEGGGQRGICYVNSCAGTLEIRNNSKLLRKPGQQIKSYTRGISAYQLDTAGTLKISIKDSEFNGFAYPLFVGGSLESKGHVEAEAVNSSFVGWCASEMYGNGNKLNFTDCSISGRNEYSGSSDNYTLFQTSYANDQGVPQGGGNEINITDCELTAQANAEALQSITYFFDDTSVINFRGNTVIHAEDGRTSIFHVGKPESVTFEDTVQVEGKGALLEIEMQQMEDPSVKVYRPDGQFYYMDTIANAIENEHVGGQNLPVELKLKNDLAEKKIEIPSGADVSIHGDNHTLSGSIMCAVADDGKLTKLKLDHINFDGNGMYTAAISAQGQNYANPTALDLMVSDSSVKNYTNKGFYLTNVKMLTAENCSFNDAPTGEQTAISGDYAFDINLCGIADAELLIKNCTFSGACGGNAPIKVTQRGGVGKTDDINTDIKTPVSASIKKLTISGCDFTGVSEKKADLIIGSSPNEDKTARTYCGKFPVVLTTGTCPIDVWERYVGENAKITIAVGTTVDKSASGRFFIEKPVEQPPVVDTEVEDTEIEKKADEQTDKVLQDAAASGKEFTEEEKQQIKVEIVQATDDLITEIINNAAAGDFTDSNLAQAVDLSKVDGFSDGTPAVVFLKPLIKDIEVEAVINETGAVEVVPQTIVFEIKPFVYENGGDEDKAVEISNDAFTKGEKITVRIPIPASVNLKYAQVVHVGTDGKSSTYFAEIKQDNSEKYAEVEVAHFSIFKVTFVDEIPTKPEPEPQPQPQPQPGKKSSRSGGGASLGTWQQNDKGWWYRYPNGTQPINVWKELLWNSSRQWYHFNPDGYMTAGWYLDTDGNKYFLHNIADGRQGYMYTGWHMIDGKWYYFRENTGGPLGSLMVNQTTPDGYTVGADGARIENAQ